jgi:hypothetical protein
VIKQLSSIAAEAAAPSELLAAVEKPYCETVSKILR